MTKQQAIKRAQQLAKRDECIMYVLREDGEWHYADDYDMDTFYCGVEPEYAVDSEGVTL